MVDSGVRIRSKLWRSRISKSLTGKTLSDSHKESLRVSHLGYIMPQTQKNNIRIALVGKKKSKEHIENARRAKIGFKFSEESKKKMSDSHKGLIPWNKGKSGKDTKHMRLSAINFINHTKGKCIPRYNPVACQKIDEYGKQHGYNFQHAENGGEFYVKALGYWIDGYDKEKNIAVEFYEKAHQRKKERDAHRKKEIIEHLGCKFIELKEWKE